jgi:hypothetical protein
MKPFNFGLSVISYWLIEKIELSAVGAASSRDVIAWV